MCNKIETIFLSVWRLNRLTNIEYGDLRTRAIDISCNQLNDLGIVYFEHKNI
jgi:hypothetical protein